MFYPSEERQAEIINAFVEASCAWRQGGYQGHAPVFPGAYRPAFDQDWVRRARKWAVQIPNVEAFVQRLWLGGSYDEIVSPNAETRWFVSTMQGRALKEVARRTEADKAAKLAASRKVRLARIQQQKREMERRRRLHIL